MKLKSVVRVFCALAIGLLPGVAHAQHSTGQYIQVVNHSIRHGDTHIDRESICLYPARHVHRDGANRRYRDRHLL